MRTYVNGSQYLLPAAGLFAIGIVLTVLVESGRTQGIDEAVFAWVGSVHTNWLNLFFSGITYLGDGFVLAPLALLAALFFWIRGDRLEAAFLIVGVLGAEIVNEGMKVIFDRSRPPGFGLIELPESASFPSGHAMVGTCFYLLLVMLISRVTALHALAAGVVACVVTTFVSASRIYLGVHYASDVLTGAVLGVSWLMVTWYWYEGAVQRYRVFRRPPRISIPKSYN